MFPQSAKPEFAKPINGEQVELRLTITKQMYKDIELLKSLYAHKNYQANMADLLKELIQLGKEKFTKQGKIATVQVDKIDKVHKAQPPKKNSMHKLPSNEPGLCAPARKLLWSTKVINMSASNLARPDVARGYSKQIPQGQPIQSTDTNPKKQNRYIPRAIARQVWQRDQGKCQYIDPLTQKRCFSNHALELDHIVPHSCQGTASPENLRLLCDKHNRWRNLQPK